ncbi:MAG: hypothetical protein IPP81_09210 [Chitinophagaceae bacterium]|nr:hypothetical protein [Chitinophagaceae bacterium]
MFTDYIEIEVSIFNGVRKYFEKLPPLDSDDYKNAFYDIVAQYEGGGNPYILIGDHYEDLIQSEILELLQKLSSSDKKTLQKFYEINFLENFINEKGDGYIYSDEDLANEITGRFKSWIEDNFSLDDLLEDDECDDDDDEEEEEDQDEDDKTELYFNKSESADQVRFLEEVIDQLYTRPLTDVQRRRLQIANVYLNHHPFVPEEDYVLSICCKSNDIHYEIVYSHDLISFSQFYTNDGSCFYNYKFRLYKTGEKEEEGELWVFTTNFEEVLKDIQLQIEINNTIP